MSPQEIIVEAEGPTSPIHFLSVAHLWFYCHERTLLSSRLPAKPHIAGHKTSVMGRNPGDLKIDELPVTYCLWRWTKHLRRKLTIEDVKHEATAFLVQSTAATVGWLKLMNSQAPCTQHGSNLRPKTERCPDSRSRDPHASSQIRRRES